MIQWKGRSPRQRQDPEEINRTVENPKTTMGIQKHKGPARGNATREKTSTCHMQKCHENNRNQFIMLKQPFETIWIWLGNYLKPIETFWNNLLKPFEFHYFAWFGQQRGCNSEFIHVKTCEHFVWALEHFLKFCLCCSAAMEGKKRWTWTGNY